jgi:hypothetical protein
VHPAHKQPAGLRTRTPARLQAAAVMSVWLYYAYSPTIAGISRGGESVGC